MRAQLLTKLGGASAIVCGALEIAARFTPLSVDIFSREALYFAVDVFLMFAVIAIYLHSSARTGFLGFVGFVLAAVGVGSIIGPDAKLGAIDQYLLGGTVFGFGMFFLGIGLLLARRQRLAAMCWVLTIIAGAAAYAPAFSEAARFVSGIIFGLGFILAGGEIFLATAAGEEA
jgi:hypothetical protein